jgi:flagellar L-ring protein precursor FlgH
MKLKTLVSTKLALLALLAAFAAANACGQSIWRDDTSRSMFVDKRASAVGDIITIVIQESSTANKNDETKTERASSLSAAITSFLYPGSAAPALLRQGQLPAMAYNSDQKHDGSGSIAKSESIVAQIAVRVIDSLPNGNLVIEGKRDTSFGGEHQTIVLRGVVRAYDVSSSNTVMSYNVADATIQIIGRGTVTDTTNKGWFGRMWDKLSPF